MKRFFAYVFLFCLFFVLAGSVNAQTADFENLSLNSESYWNGSDISGGFYSGGFTFNNNYVNDPLYPSWDGFAYSNITTTTVAGAGAQYNAITGSGADGSEIYAVAYVSSFAENPPTITLDTEQVLSGAFFTNNNYAFYSMRDGDDFAKEFDEGDWFKLTITGIDAEGTETGTVEFKLADGTSIVKTWKWVDLSGLGAVTQLIFELSSSDTGDWGMNTPAYFCIDNLNNDDSVEYDSDNSDGSSCFIRSMK